MSDILLSSEHFIPQIDGFGSCAYTFPTMMLFAGYKREPSFQIPTICKDALYFNSMSRTFSQQPAKRVHVLYPGSAQGATSFSSFSNVSSMVYPFPLRVMFLPLIRPVVDIDGTQDAPGKHIYQSLIIGEPGPYVRLPSHSFLARLGPQVYIILLDCRYAQRT